MSGPRRILFLSSCVRGGGAGWSLYYLLKNIDRERIEPLVVVPERGIFDTRFDDLGLRVREAKWLPHRVLQQRFSVHNAATHYASAAINVGRMALFVRQLARMIEREKIDLVYCNNMMVKPLGAFGAQLAGVPCVLHVRNIHEDPSAVAFYGSIAKLGSVRRIISNSAASAVPYENAAPGKVVVIHNGVDLTEYEPGAIEEGAFRRRFELTGETIIGFTGNLIPRKGIDTLIRAAAEVLPGREDVVVVVLGRVPIGSKVDHGEYYRDLAQGLRIGDRVRFLGFVEDVRSAVADFDILALPSRQEPFGRSIIEAMALGTPVVASRVGGIPEIIESGEHGLLTEPGDPTSLARALAELLDRPALRAQLAENALKRVEECFDVAKLTGAIQEELLAAID